MSSINRIYNNEIGISFFWKKRTITSIPKIQLVFRDTGFLLSLNELKDFSSFCSETRKTQACAQCKNVQTCRSLLLKTPSNKIDLAVSLFELEQLQDLINTTIFKVEQQYWLRDWGLN